MSKVCEQDFFMHALPVWEKDKENEKNNTLLFRSVIEKKANVILRVTGSSMYQIFVNGQFAGTGPARAAHTYFRVDELDLTPYLTKDKNIILIQVAGYYINSFYLLEQSAFLCAEIFAGNECLAATGRYGFEARSMRERVQKVQRYSYQRSFVEVYNWNGELELIKNDPLYSFEPVVLQEQRHKQYMGRQIYYPQYEIEPVDELVERGQVCVMQENVREYRDRSLICIGDSLRGYKEDELTVCSTDLLCKQVYIKNANQVQNFLDEVKLSVDEYVTYSFGKNLSGVVEFTVECPEDTTLYMTFDEIQAEGDYGFRWKHTANVVIWNLKPGNYRLITFEPYTMQYLRFASIGGSCSLKDIHLRRYGFPEVSKKLVSNNDKLQKIYDAAIETFRQNVFDIPMDCPSRERAGWLCDSFFTSRTEYVLTDKNEVEKNFLENYSLAYNCTVPEGMLPMCYPSDSEIQAEYIPQWGMWFVLELDDYYKRTNDGEIVQLAKHKVDELKGFFEKYENEFGLLEKLPGAQMIEWSASRDYMNDVNFPTNMLYVAMLECIGRLYNDKKAKEKSKDLKKTILHLSYKDGFFVDNAIRSNGKLEVTKNYSECCQYLAFFTGVADMKEHATLWETLVSDFGYHRRHDNKWGNVVMANAFVGNCLRMHLLCVFADKEKLLKDIEEYFYYMAEKTGTLWEYESENASCNHGFASYIIWLFSELNMLTE